MKQIYLDLSNKSKKYKQKNGAFSYFESILSIGTFIIIFSITASIIYTLSQSQLSVFKKYNFERKAELAFLILERDILKATKTEVKNKNFYIKVDMKEVKKLPELANQEGNILYLQLYKKIDNKKEYNADYEERDVAYYYNSNSHFLELYFYNDRFMLDRNVLINNVKCSFIKKGKLLKIRLEMIDRNRIKENIRYEKIYEVKE